jgi:hypothetical protein
MAEFLAAIIPSSHHDVLHHAPEHIRQPEIASCVAVPQPLVVEAEQVQDGGVEIVDVEGVFRGVHAEFIGGAVRQAASKVFIASRCI